jgi:hypothetical protein
MMDATVHPLQQPKTNPSHRSWPPAAAQQHPCVQPGLAQCAHSYPTPQLLASKPGTPQLLASKPGTPQMLALKPRASAAASLRA